MVREAAGTQQSAINKGSPVSDGGCGRRALFCLERFPITWKSQHGTSVETASGSGVEAI